MRRCDVGGFYGLRPAFSQADFPAPGAREHHVWQQPVADDDDKNDSHRRLQDFRNCGVLVRKYEIADEQRNSCGAELDQKRNGHGRTTAGCGQPGLNQVFKCFDIFLEVAGKEFAGLAVQTR